MATPNLQEIHDCFIEIALKAGDMITGAKPLVNTVGSKLNSGWFFPGHSVIVLN